MSDRPIADATRLNVARPSEGGRVSPSLLPPLPAVMDAASQAGRGKLLRCRICGFTGRNVSSGIFKTNDGKYLTVARCEDHVACDSRKPSR